jgi:signal transduction histidine kinase
MPGMTTATGTFARVGAWTVVAGSLAMVGAGIAVVVGDGRAPLDTDEATSWAVSVGSGLLGGFVVTRHPAHRVGWLFLAIALLRAAGGLATSWSTRAYTLGIPTPAADVAAWTQLWTVPIVVPLAAIVLLLFPDGVAVGPFRWPVAGLSVAGVVLLGIAVPVVTWPLRGPVLAPDSPLPDDPLAHAGWAVWLAGTAAGLVAAVLALAALFLDARRGPSPRRQQILWFAYGAAVSLVVDLVADLAGLLWLRAFGPVALLAGAGLAIFRYRLYDIDRLINRTLVYGLLTAAALASYAAVAVMAGLLLGGQSTAVAAVAAFVVALALRPGRDAVQDLVDRVFARRAHSAGSRLRALAREVGRESVDPARVTAALRGALREPGLEVLFHVHDTRGLVTGDGVPAVIPAGADHTAVGLRGRPVAVLVHGPVETDLLRAVTDAAAVVLEHARLQAELRVRLGEVRASRSRLVTAADDERRRIERDLHDGAQQRLVGLAVHIQATRRTITTTPPIDELLTRSVTELHHAVADIRALVHNILPPALATGGLAAALAELARPGEVGVDIDLGSSGLEPITESTAWFVAAEGVTNARKHAAGALITVHARVDDGLLVVTVCDAGPGGADPTGAGLRGLTDRVEACGGELTVLSRARTTPGTTTPGTTTPRTSTPGTTTPGTTLTARLPTRVRP